MGGLTGEALQSVDIADAFGRYQLQAFAGDAITEVMRRTSKPYEWRLLQAVGRLVRDGDVVIDVGANIGNHSVSFARRGCAVVAVEPNSAVLGVLRSNIDALGLTDRITICALAVGSESTLGTVVSPASGNIGASLVHADGVGDVTIRRLDDVVADVASSHGLGRVALIKIDVEGAELDVLRGATGLLDRERPDLIVEHSTSATEAIAAVLGPFGYRRLPMSLAAAPTFLWSTSTRKLAKLAATGLPMLEELSRAKARFVR